MTRFYAFMGRLNVLQAMAVWAVVGLAMWMGILCVVIELVRHGR